MKNLLEPALELARRSSDEWFQFFDIRVLKPIMTREAESRDIFYPNDRSLQVGDILKMPKMADYLEYPVSRDERSFIRVCQATDPDL